MRVVHHLGQLYVAKADYVNAERQLRTAYDAVAASLFADHRYAIFALSWLAKTVMQQRRWSDTKVLLERDVETSRQVWPEGNIDAWVFECRLGGALVELGELDGARTILEGCYPNLVDVLGDDAEDSRQAAGYLERFH
jgi:hypothetical protein